nr:hypothetical protein [Ceratocystis fimbriata]
MGWGGGLVICMINLNFVLYISVSLLCLTSSAVLAMHSFSNSYILVYISGFLVTYTFGLWFRDIISEGTIMSKYNSYYNLNIAKAIDKEKIIKFLSDYKSKNNPKVLTDKNDLGYYLGGLLEGDGHISLPSVGSTTLNRVLNPRIVFTSHIDNLGMYSLIQSELGNIGRFQQTGKNVLRYIIGDMKGIIQILNLVHGKLRTPKNKRFNDLIKFINLKYSLDIPYSLLDKSNLQQNAWFSGFSEADAHFGIKYVESKPKSETRKRSVSESVSLKFRLDQRAFDKSTSIDMRPFMDTLALFLSCDIKTYKNNTNSEVLSLTVSAINDIKPIIDYFNKYPLLGNKLEDFKKWEIVFNMILVKEHLTEEGKLKIKSLLNKL